MFNALKKNFELIYNRQHYVGFYKIYDRIITFIYIRRLFKNLRTYINHYSEYEFNQIKRYKFYENMIFIDKSRIFFYIIIINFIITFLVTVNKCDYLFIVINKFSKRVLIIPDRIIYNIVEWVNLLLVILTRER